MQKFPLNYNELICKSLRNILQIQNENQEDIVIREGNMFSNRLSSVVVHEEDWSRNSNTENLFDGRQSVYDIPTVRQSKVQMDNFDIIMKNNQLWSTEHLEKDPQYFSRLKKTQSPQYLWIGCSDSRVPANEIVGLKPGELFVHRNIANQAPLSDVSVLSVIQFSVQVLKVKDIIVCGHYGCGGVKAAFKNQDHGSLECWLSFIRDLRARYRNEFKKHSSEQNQDLLVELNVKQQVLNISRHASVQKAWDKGEELRIHGLVYQLQDGKLKNLKLTLTSPEQLPLQYKIY